jgi:hypothetical protein
VDAIADERDGATENTADEFRDYQKTCCRKRGCQNTGAETGTVIVTMVAMRVAVRIAVRV